MLLRGLGLLRVGQPFKKSKRGDAPVAINSGKDLAHKQEGSSRGILQMTAACSHKGKRRLLE